MTRWKLIVEYDGSGFSGWQRQAHAFSAQQALEDAVFAFSGERVTLHVAGRTDTGVHARANVAHMDLEKKTDGETVRDAVNYHLRPHHVSVLAAEEVSEEFHARFDARWRSYRYRILCRRAPPALEAGRVWHVRKALDVEAMREAAAILIGHHDFSTFRASACQANSPMRTLDQLDIWLDEEREEVVLATRARSFLYHQVRNMVGTLALVGGGQWTLDDFREAFAACDRRAGGPTAPAQGLAFWEVGYDSSA
ncbi:MAG: tRNA pseudouridine(38-40) synthase TruA [Bdellovibrionales bacterium]